MKSLHIWLKFAIFNLFIVAVLGTVMRYKIAFSLPIVEQKNLQQSHSHFAFYGWITFIIYVLIVKYLREVVPNLKEGKYKWLVISNLVASFGMLISFIYNGYFWLSIAFSTMALLTSFVFYFVFSKDMKGISDISKKWLHAAFFFAVFSSLGVFTLSIMMATKNFSQDVFLASEYFYLHFQYNGFFIFSCIAFLLNNLKKMGVAPSEKENNLIFWLSFVGCLVGYGLSVLWFKMPLWMFAAITVTTLMQTWGAYLLFKVIKDRWSVIKQHWSPMLRLVLIYVGFAFGVKIILQLGSNIPAVNQFAFGFRNIVIAYLHLVLLMCVSAFLVGQMLASNLFSLSKALLLGVQFFLLGVFLNELVLGSMGLLSTIYFTIPYTAEALVVISFFIMFSAFYIFMNMNKAND
ncbi:hypothetical protein [Amniculibacterium sp. G2-70]|uniref:hypothetical protein n=1 Tax=Amniculibacterium sp. G2-70 TaxID=2767188 RepID=UPI001654B8F6|nr:hypothetical protein [Amniculibacterium sp. G2-70]